MWEGTVLPHSGQDLSCGLRQRFAPRRIRCFILDTLRFGTAMVEGALRLLVGLVWGAFEGVERAPSAVSLRGGRVLYITFRDLVHR